MKLRNISTIISREYLTRVKKKSFLLTTFLVPIFFAAVCILPSVIMVMATDKGKEIAVLDQSGIVKPYLVDNKSVTYSFYDEAIDDKQSFVSEKGVDALVIISPVDSVNKTLSVASYSEKPLSIDLTEDVRSKVNDAVEDYRISQYDIADLKAIMEDIRVNTPMSTYVFDESGQEKESSFEVPMIISMVLSMIIYIFVMMFSGMVMQSVIEEKSSRVVEVLVSSVKATELMFGKIIGVACVALTQFFLWIVLTLVLVGGFAAFVGFDSIMGDPAQAQEMMEMTTQMGGADMAQMTAAISQESGLGTVLSTLMDFNWGQMIFAFIIYFVLGYLLYASFFAAIGSAVENEADTQQLQTPLTVPLLLSFFIAMYAFKAPDSPVVWWGSMIPFTSPIVMLARIPYGVPAWELALSIAVLVAAFIACGWASAKIYKIGILMFGKKTTFKDLWKWLRQN